MSPQYIALFGNPGAGKTKAAEILQQQFGYILADDGLPLREIAMKYLGLTHRQCFTQEGKKEIIQINGRDWEARKVLGEIGNAFEDKFGGEIIPQMAHATFDLDEKYVMASCRREQGAYWKSVGAICVEIVNDFAPPSPFEFDWFNPTHIDYRIKNDFNPAAANEADAEKALLKLAFSLFSLIRHLGGQ